MAAESMPEFYMRPLPSACVDMSSQEGQTLFAQAMASGTTSAFFPLVAQFRTQDEPAYCGLASLTMVLNALRVDPQSKWKGVWRWYSEESLSCCKPLDKVKKEGVSLAQLACLARCNALHVRESHSPAACDGLLDSALAAGAEAGALEQGAAMLMQDAHAIIASLAASGAPGQQLLRGLDEFRAAVAATCGAPPPLRGAVVANYNRGDLQQTGTGHFSPLGAFDAASDAVLVLDTARFKYPAHWVALPRLYLATCRSTGADGGARGWLQLSRMAASPLLVFEMSANLFQEHAPRPCGKGCSGEPQEGQTCAQWSSLLQEVHDEVRSALRGDSMPCSAQASAQGCTAHGADAAGVSIPVLALRGIAKGMHHCSHTSPGARALSGLLSASVCQQCSGGGTSAPAQRKLSAAQLLDAQRLLAALQETQMYKWVHSAIGAETAAVPPSEGKLGVSAVHSLSILLLAVCTPQGVLADLAGTPSGGSSSSESKEKVDTCCSTADEVWRQLQGACEADLGAAGGAPSHSLLRSEVFMLQQQLSQAQPSERTT